MYKSTQYGEEESSSDREEKQKIQEVTREHAWVVRYVARTEHLQSFGEEATLVRVEREAREVVPRLHGFELLIASEGVHVYSAWLTPFQGGSDTYDAEAELQGVRAMR